jgi:hypothetical protein
MPATSHRAPAELARRLSVAEAVEYLARVHGVRMKPNALRLHRFKGTGPECCVILRKLYFEPQALDAWINGLAASSRESRKRARNARL